MRKLFRISAITAVALSTFALTAHAQGAKSFGILAGVDFATMSGSDFNTEDLSSKTGFIGGLYVTLPVGPSIAIEPEVLYAMKGTKANELDLAINNDYIEIPVLLKYTFNPNGGPYLLAGPAVGFSISCNESVGSSSVSCSDAGGVETQTTIGGVVGIGFQKSRFGLEGRYDFDFGGAFKDYNVKNQVWEILARIMIK